MLTGGVTTSCCLRVCCFSWLLRIATIPTSSHKAVSVLSIAPMGNTKWEKKNLDANAKNVPMTSTSASQPPTPQNARTI